MLGSWTMSSWPLLLYDDMGWNELLETADREADASGWCAENYRYMSQRMFYAWHLL